MRLVLVLVIDQARFEYLERLRPIFKRGMKLLLDEGMQFTDAHQDHAKTSTGPGHASLATGLYPSHSGIVGNSCDQRQMEFPQRQLEIPTRGIKKKSCSRPLRRLFSGSSFL